MAAITYSNQDINRFWLNILADNTLIVYNAFSPSNVEEAPHAIELTNKFDNLSSRAGQNLTSVQLNQLNADAYTTTQNYRLFFLALLDTMLTKRIHLDLKPEMINDMINMAEYYLNLLNIYMQGQQPAFNPILEDIFWLSFFVKQTRYITDNAGQYDGIYHKKAIEFADIFNENWMVAIELHGFSRIGKTDFPVEKEKHNLMQKVMTNYYEYLSNILTLVDEDKLPGSLSVLFLDCSRRLACFYLTNLSIINNNKKPDCDPYAHRKSIL